MKNIYWITFLYILSATGCLRATSKRYEAHFENVKVKAVKKHKKDDKSPSNDDVVDSFKKGAFSKENTQVLPSLSSNLIGSRELPKHNVGIATSMEVKIISAWLRKYPPNSSWGKSVANNIWSSCHTMLVRKFTGRKLLRERLAFQWDEHVEQEEEEIMDYLQKLVGNGKKNSSERSINGYITLPMGCLRAYSDRQVSVGNVTFAPLPLVMEDFILRQVSTDQKNGTITYQAIEYAMPEHIIWDMGAFTSEELFISSQKKKRWWFNYTLAFTSYYYHNRDIKNLLQLHTIGFIRGMVGIASYVEGNQAYVAAVLRKDTMKGCHSLATLKKENPALAIEKMEDTLQRLLQLGCVEFSSCYRSEKLTASWAHNIWVNPKEKGIFLFFNRGERSYFSELLYSVTIIKFGDIKQDGVNERFRRFWRYLFQYFSGWEQLQEKITAINKMDLEATKKILGDYAPLLDVSIINIILEDYVGCSLPSKTLKKEILPPFANYRPFGMSKEPCVLDLLFQRPFSLKDGEFSFAENLIEEIKKGVVKEESVKKNIERFKKYFGQLEREELNEMKEKYDFNICGIRGILDKKEHYFDYIKDLKFPDPSFFDLMLSNSSKEEPKRNGFARYLLYAAFCQDIYTLALPGGAKDDGYDLMAHRASSFLHYPYKKALLKFLFPLQDIGMPFSSAKRAT